MITKDELLLQLSYLDSIEAKVLAKKAFEKGVCEKDFIELKFSDDDSALTKQEISKLCTVIDNAKKLTIPSAKHFSKDIQAISLWDNTYPSKLKELPDPPIILYYRGDINIAEENHHVAIVGTRKATGYGLKFTQLFSSMLSDVKIVIVSGLAYGIDAKAHESSLNTGKTIAVLGCGVDDIYPKSNRGLASAIIEQGGLIVSEYFPGSQVNPWHFPQRNRLISALSDAVIVIEGDTQSGALITARFAIKQGKPLFALPGSLASYVSNGPNALIKSKSATLITSVNDIYEALGISKQEEDLRWSSDTYKVKLTKEQKHIINCISYNPIGFEELLTNTKLSFDELVQNLSFLELNNLIVQSIDGGYVRT